MSEIQFFKKHISRLLDKTKKHEENTKDLLKNIKKLSMKAGEIIKNK